jgi:hypothetical protein
MKLAFEIVRIPDLVLHTGNGDVINEVIIVEIPDDIIPERIRNDVGNNADLDREYVSRITYVNDGNDNVKRYNEN